MARILITTTPIHGHIYASLLLAQRLVERGNEVVWYTGKRFKEAIEAVGVRHVAMERFDYDDRILESEFTERSKHEGLDKIKFDLKNIFINPLPAYYEELLRILDTFPAQIIVCDPASFFVLPLILAGEPKGLKFAATGFIPLSLSSVDTPPFGPGLPFEPGEENRAKNMELNKQIQTMFADVQQHLNQVLTENGFPQTDVYWGDTFGKLSGLYLQYTIPSFEYPRSDLPSHVRFVGPMLSKSTTANFMKLPDWWGELNGHRPVVHVTQGTIDNNNFNRLITPTIQALAQEDVLVVVSTGEQPASAISLNLPDNVRVTENVPYDQFLPLVDVMVTNGGYGGVQFALSNGVPLITAGDTEDKPEVGQRVVWSGAGINLQTGTPTVQQIHTAVKEILTNNKYRARAKELQAEYAKYDGPNDAAHLLEKLAETGSIE